MANRSDFFTAKLPRQYKRLLAIGQTYGWIQDSHERGSIKRSLISAHAAHVGFKMKRQANDVGEAE